MTDTKDNDYLKRRLIIMGSEVVSQEQAAGTWQEVCRVNTSDFLSRLMQKLSQELLFFPLPRLGRDPLELLLTADPGRPPLGWVRCFQSCGTTRCYLFEQPPQIMPLNFCLDNKGELVGRTDQSSLLRLALPWVIFICKLTRDHASLHCYFRQQPLATANDILLEPMLPNIGIGARNSICMHIPHQPDLPDGQQMLLAIDTFWHSQFTSDYQWHYLAARKHVPQLTPLQTWESVSQIDPSLVIKASFPPITSDSGQRLTVLSAMDMITNGRSWP